MTNRDLLKDAIADAKAVKETAIANAKLALEESFTPHLKSMLASKLEEMEKEEDIDENLDNDFQDEEDFEVNDEFDSIEDLDSIDDFDSTGDFDSSIENFDSTDDFEEELDLDEILNEEESNESDEETEESDEESDKEISIEDMSEEDLIKFIEDVIQDMITSGEIEPIESEEEESDEESEEEESDEESEEEESEKEKIKENVKYISNLKEIIRSKTLKLNESYKIINGLKKELNEINVLNSKLLYVNKIFKSKNLSESKKMDVLKAFDKATNVKEAKMIYETLNINLPKSEKSFTKPNRNAIRGIASKTLSPINESKQPIIDVDPLVERWQKLAGIK